MGIIFKAPGIIIYFVGGIWGFVICFNIVKEAWGLFWAILSVFIAPIVLVLAPWYKAIAHGEWFPVILVYGCFLIGSIMFAIGSKIDKDEET